jgi:nitrilase
MPLAAIIQRSPVFLDRAACLKLAVEAVAEAAEAGARLAVFPEAFVPGYPAWIWCCGRAATCSFRNGCTARCSATP